MKERRSLLCKESRWLESKEPVHFGNTNHPFGGSRSGLSESSSPRAWSSAALADHVCEAFAAHDLTVFACVCEGVSSDLPPLRPKSVFRRDPWPSAAPSAEARGAFS